MDTKISAGIPKNTRAYFIKLGPAGRWEDESTVDGTIRFGYSHVPHELCIEADWDGVRESLIRQGDSPGVATRHRDQIKAYYELDDDSLFITFAKGYLWWCRPTGPVELLTDGTKTRRTVDGWHKESLAGSPLLISTLSGKLLKTRMFRGTICDVSEQAYLLRKINDEALQEYEAIEAAEKVMIPAVLDLIRLLNDKDFELLVELIFANSGWRRQSSTGGNEKTIDIDLLLPSTRERAFVQVKSKASTRVYLDYADAFGRTDAHERMFFVWHTGKVEPPTEHPAITLWGPELVARMALDAGLISWLKDRAC